MKTVRQIFILCGIALIMLAAFPVFGQDKPVINSQPLTDFAAEFLDRYENGELDLNDNFLVDVEGELNKDGKLDPQKTRYVRSSGNEQTVEMVKRAIEALNDSGMFANLSNFGAKKLNLIVSQNDKTIYGTINADFESEQRAKPMVSLLNIAIKGMKENRSSQGNLLLLNGTTVSSDGKTVTIKTAVERTAALEMFKLWLNERSERRKENGS